MTKPSCSVDPTYYEILDLHFGQNQKPFSNQDIKLAWRRALLVAHPDKAKTVSKEASFRPRYTVDQITTAYNTLSDPLTRAEYDKSARFTSSNYPADKADVFHTGLETVDLEDMTYDDDHQAWHRSCRCGEFQGFSVTEDELEKESESGEILTGCRGCSLWLRILFAVSPLVDENQDHNMEDTKDT